jgi:hypothetical protein
MPKARKLDLSLPLQHHQLLSSIILEVGLPSNRDAWARVISRLPPRAYGRATIAQAASNRYTTVKRRWDQVKLFGENHDEMVEMATKQNRRRQPEREEVIEGEEEDEIEPMVGGTRNKVVKEGKRKQKERVKATESSEGSGDEAASGSEHSEHEDEAFAAGRSRKRSLEAEDLDESRPKKSRKTEKKVTFQEPVEDLPCWSEVETEV